MSHPATAGLLLAGGQARRMGGGDKPLMILAGRTILARVIERLAPQCAELAISAHGDPARFAAYGLQVIADDLPGFAGPLAGILAGLDALAPRQPEGFMVSVAADTPFIPPDLVRRLHEGRCDAGTPLACAASGGRTHPVIGLWPVAARIELRRMLDAGERKVGAVMARLGCTEVVWPSTPIDPFFNANRPEDLAEAERMLAGSRG